MGSQLTSPLVWILAFFLLLFVYTKFAGPLPLSVNSVTTQKSQTFDVTGEGKVTVKPDTAFVTAGIQSQAQTVKQAQEQINSIINKVSEALKQLGIDTKDIQTTNYHIYPIYDYLGNTQRINGYTAGTNLSIKVSDIDKINQVIDTATANGANQVSGVSFDVSDKTKIESEAREKAVEAAKKKATEASRIAGFRLGRIINYSENFQGFGGPVPLVERALDAKATGTPTEVEPGSKDITVTVTLNYEIL